MNRKSRKESEDNAVILKSKVKDLENEVVELKKVGNLACWLNFFIIFVLGRVTVYKIQHRKATQHRTYEVFFRKLSFSSKLNCKSWVFVCRRKRKSKYQAQSLTLCKNS